MRAVVVGVSSGLGRCIAIALGQKGDELALLERTAEEWAPLLADFTGQWTWVQSTLDVVQDPQAVANGYVADVESSEGERFQLVTAPIQYGGQPAQPGRSPEFNEHGDAILEALGLDMDAIIDLKVKGVVA